MTHTCRESCGVCGFLSPFNMEEQIVGILSYSNFTRDDFDCGRNKPLCKINSEVCARKRTFKRVTESLKVTIEKPNQPIDADDDVFLSNDPS